MMWRVACVAALILSLVLPAAAQTGRSHAPSVSLLALDNSTTDPFAAAASAKSVVFLFVSVECPISNRYAPEVNRLHQRFAGAAGKGSAGGGAQGSAAFWLVYPNPADTPERIREHMKAYGYTMPALRDPKHALVKLVGATITPEAAVYDAARRLAYRGRIDDKYVAIGLERPNPTRRDLDQALTAVFAGGSVPEPRTQAVGCYIADFVHVHP